MENSYIEGQDTKKCLNNNYSNKLVKMQEWNKYTVKEKYEYNLSNYIKNFCKNVNIDNELNILKITKFVLDIMYANKDNFEGSKRSKVKDGIIIMCIYYVYKNSVIDQTISYLDLAKIVNLQTKYLSNADKLIIELINNKKLTIDFNINSLETPMDYVNNIYKYQLKIDKHIIDKVDLLINICEDNDIILNCNPLSIGTSCLYYILTLSNIQIDLKVLSKIYNLSTSTIIKTHNLLKSKSKELATLGIN
jgi:transcription initiation factor TFIIIB Brf1 subunit/transcription initiation factor TFIIB